MSMPSEIASSEVASKGAGGGVLLVGGSPEPSSSALVSELAARAALVVAVDRGADWCREAGVLPHVFCGDADTAASGSLAWLREAGRPVELFSAEKDDTDLGLAIALARREAPGAAVTATCVSGGRPDHALGVFGVLARAADLSPRIVEDGFECRLLSPRGTGVWELGPDACGREFSLVALTPSVVSERGMRWELERASLESLSDLGVSNRVASSTAVVECHEGVVAAFLRVPRA